MKNKLLLILAAACISFSLLAQLAPAPPLNNAGNTNTLELKLAEKYTLRSIELDKALATKNLPRIKHGANGQMMEAMSVTPTGHVIYTTTYNIGAGRTLSTNKVWPGGAVGVALTGAGMINRLGVWDGGKVLDTHQEFSNNRVSQPDGATKLSDHATHVAATMIASGVSANAKGMSYMAPLKAYDWANDATEMLQAAQSGMLISNHSYGTISGWNYNTDQSRWEWWGDRNVSTATDYKFGQYDERAAEWDDIAVTYPFYLICKAAGNDRGDLKSTNTNEWYYSDGTPGSGTAPGKDGGTTGYDCIPQYGTAKNILTVGAVNKIGGNNGNGWVSAGTVEMSDFSGWGPTDDGRIKPDVVAPGVNLYSAISTGTANYDIYSGTSMATPAASGSLLLVQQHHNNVKGKYLRSASLKALAIHTADEAGSKGPDYAYGWGLLNTASCVKFINDSNLNKLDEKTLNNGQTQTVQFNVDAGKPLRITICWTDKPGNPVSSNLLNNTTKMLVNDLDIRLTRVSDQSKFNPYILNPASPATAATTGDNTRDNVEMIHIDAPEAGIYTLAISHKGTLSGASQPFSLLISNGVEKASAAFYANKTVICPGQSIQYTDASGGGITSRKWYFPGGNPSASTLANPVVTYSTAGNYPVALKVTSALGEDSVYIKNYATVGGLALPFTETFEEASPTSTSWSVDNPDADITWAYYNTSGLTSGERSAGINYFDYAQKGQRDGLISPPLSFKGFTNVSLSFKHAYTKYNVNSNSDSLLLYVSNNCGVSWIKMAVFYENGTGSFATFGESNGYGSNVTFLPAAAEDWCGAATGSSCKTVSLNPFNGSASILLKFEGVCNYSNNLFIDNITVTGTPLKPVAGLSVSQTTVCANTPVSFNDISQNHPAAWAWSFPGANVTASNIQNPVVSYPNPGTYTVKLKVSNVTGSDSVELNNYITVVAQPTTPNIKAAGPIQFCVGDSVALSTDSTGPVKWYFNNGLIAQNTQQVYAKKTGIYRVAKSNGTCEVSSSVNITSSVKDARPTISASVTGTAFCEGNSSLLTSSAATGNQWYKNNVAITGAVNVTYLANDSGSYTVISNTAGCPSDASLPKTYSIFPKPLVGTVSGPDNPKRDETVTYSVSDESGYTYHWSIVNGNVVSGNSTATITAKFTSIDSAVISVLSRSTASGCSSVASVKRILVAPAVGLNEQALIQALAVYPIPVKDVLTIHTESIRSHQSALKVINILGQVCMQQELQLNNGSQKHTLDVSSLTKGIYFIELQSENQKTVKKFIVE